MIIIVTMIIIVIIIITIIVVIMIMLIIIFMITRSDAIPIPNSGAPCSVPSTPNESYRPWVTNNLLIYDNLKDETNDIQDHDDNEHDNI